MHDRAGLGQLRHSVERGEHCIDDDQRDEQDRSRSASLGVPAWGLLWTPSSPRGLAVQRDGRRRGANGVSRGQAWLQRLGT